ncbi:hypothetical protein ACLMJK_001767 [Lecanora helva]
MKGQRCGQGGCPSREYYDDSGFTFCSRGHQQEGQQTQQDDEDLQIRGRKTKRKPEKQEQVSQSLPAELEVVVKDLWALRLQLVKDKIDATTSEDIMHSSLPVSEEESDEEGQPERRKWEVKGKSMPTLIETLGLLYLGSILLRLPICMGDIYRDAARAHFLHSWAIREDIPFIRAIRYVPPFMKQRLPAEYLSALDTTADDSSLKVLLHPLTLFIATLLDLNFSFPKPKRRQQASSLPELTLISLLVITTKLYHPFNNDRQPRHARSLTDPAALMINWSRWAEAHQAHKARMNPEDQLPRGSEINITENDVMNMKSKEIDDYMDWYERTFVDEERAETKNHGLPKQLLDMFPTGRQDASAPTPYSYQGYAEKEQASTREKLASVMGSLQMRPIASDHGAEDGQKEAKIGSFYRRYRTVEDLDQDNYARGFHETVAEVVGVKLETLLICVGQLERKLIMWREAKIKEGVEDVDDSSGPDKMEL